MSKEAYMKAAATQHREMAKVGFVASQLGNLSADAGTTLARLASAVNNPQVAQRLGGSARTFETLFGAATQADGRPTVLKQGFENAGAQVGAKGTKLASVKDSLPVVASPSIVPSVPENKGTTVKPPTLGR
jgi:hypothetical protein